MNGLLSSSASKFGLAIVGVCLLTFPHLGPSDEPGQAKHSKRDKETEAAVDPFVDQEKAAELMRGIWEYSADYALKPQGIGNVPGLVGPKGQRGWPFEEQKKGESSNAPPQKMTSHFRIDLRSKSKFRMEGYISNHADKTFNYSFGEGNWKLRGRLLVLTFLLDDEVARQGVFIERLGSNEIGVRGIGESVELFEDGKGALKRIESAKPVGAPKGYEVEVDESSFGSAKTDIAEYLREVLKIDVE